MSDNDVVVEEPVVSKKEIGAWLRKADKLIELSAEVQRLRDERAEAIAEASAPYEGRLSKLQKKADELEEEVVQFGLDNRVVAFDGKSKTESKLATITVRARPVSVAVPEDLTDLEMREQLRDADLDMCIQTKESINKAVIKQLLSEEGEAAEDLCDIGFILVGGFSVAIKAK